MYKISQNDIISVKDKLLYNIMELLQEQKLLKPKEEVKEVIKEIKEPVKKRTPTKKKTTRKANKGGK